MKEMNTEIKYKDRTYHLVFNLNVMEQIQDKFETIAQWGELTDGSKGEVNIKALVYGFTAMLNEGIEIDNDENGTKEPLLTSKQVGRMLSDLGLEEVSKKMTTTVIESTKSDEKN